MKLSNSLMIPVGIIASIFCLRMLGLFMILPIFSPYAHQLSGQTPTLIGLAIGIYGLSQAVLQLPFGMLSDRIGRKPVLICGLTIFIVGSILAGYSTSIYGVILGRFLQGAGAIGSTLIALVADLTDENDRAKAMAMIGISIGLSFSLAIFLGPLLTNWLSVPGIFFLTAILGALGIVVVLLGIPSITPHHTEYEPLPKLFKSVLTNPALIRLDLGIFIQHAILTANFVVIPVLLQQMSIGTDTQWHFYLPILLTGFIISGPMIVIGEKYRLLKPLFLIAIALVATTELGLAILPNNRRYLILLLSVFFVGFNFLEASLPALISKAAPKHAKGTAMGIYSFSQFFGIFAGGVLGGYLFGLHHTKAVFLICSISAFFWLLFAYPTQLSFQLRQKLFTRKSILDKLE